VAQSFSHASALPIACMISHATTHSMWGFGIVFYFVSVFGIAFSHAAATLVSLSVGWPLSVKTWHFYLRFFYS
jgi:hypothetical protein